MARPGIDLLALTVTFNDHFDIQELREKSRDENNYEQEFVNEYTRCIRRLSAIRKELKQTWKAHIVPIGMLRAAISQLQREYEQARKDLRTLADFGSPKEVQEDTRMIVSNLRSILSKLRKIQEEGA